MGGWEVEEGGSEGGRLVCAVVVAAWWCGDYVCVRPDATTICRQ